MAERKVTISVRIDLKVLDAFDALAEAERRTRSELASFAMEEYIKRHESKPKKKAKPVVPE